MISRKKILLFIASLFSISAHASFIDTDPYCTNYGCVVVSDDNTSNVYDVYNYIGTSAVPVGGQLNDYTTTTNGGPIAGSGTVDPLFTNTNTNVSTMAANQGNRIQISNQVGGGGVFTYPASGLLNAATTLTKFGIQSTTRIDYATPGSVANLGDSPQSHSFYISSRNVTFNIRATATLVSSTGELPTNVTGSNIGVLLTITPSGTVATSGQLFGTNVNATYSFTNVVGLNLNSLSANPVVASFNGANIYSTANSGATIYTKSIRLNTSYTLPPFSLSQGAGDMRWNVSFSFWRK